MQRRATSHFVNHNELCVADPVLTLILKVNQAIRAVHVLMHAPSIEATPTAADDGRIYCSHLSIRVLVIPCPELRLHYPGPTKQLNCYFYRRIPTAEYSARSGGVRVQKGTYLSLKAALHFLPVEREL